jgi:hypothetical protein
LRRRYGLAVLVTCGNCGNGIVEPTAVACPVCGSETAEEIHVQRTAVEPSDAVETLRTLAAGLLRSGQHMEAMGVVQMWIGAEPGAAAPHAAMGELLAAMGRFAEALASLDKAIALGLDDPAVRRLKADCQARLAGAPPPPPRANVEDLSAGAALAMKVAAMEANGAGHERLERAHVLLGILSLEKFHDATPDELGLPSDTVEALRQEIARVVQVLPQSPATHAELRQRLRDELGPGTAPSGRGSISRSDACRLAFRSAAEHARGTALSALDLLAAVCDEPDPAIDLAFRHHGLDVEDVAEAVRSRSIIGGLVKAVKQQHGVDLQVSSEAEMFLAKAGLVEARRLILTPLAGLVHSGKLAKHAVWRIVYDEGGVYLLPAERPGTR